MEDIRIELAIIGGIISMALSYRFFFKDISELWSSIKFCFIPDIISMFRGEYLQDAWSELKVIWWIIFGAIMGLGVYDLIGRFY